MFSDPAPEPDIEEEEDDDVDLDSECAFSFIPDMEIIQEESEEIPAVATQDVDEREREKCFI